MGLAGTHLADYTYLGLSTIVQQANPEASQELTYIHQSGDTLSSSDGGDRYTGLDRFGRVIDQYWLNTSSLGSGTVDRLQYGYDRDGNVLYSKNLINGAFSELYHANSSTSGDNNAAYDSLNRLTTIRRGTLTSSGNNGSALDTVTSGNLNSTSGVPNQNAWNLDAIGNWNSSSPGGTSETNAFNSQNEETTNGSSTLTFDSNGNMTVDQSGLHYVYDAWNNLKYTYNASNTTLLETRYYDARNRLAAYDAGSGFQFWYYSAQNQLAELAIGGTYTQMVYGLGYQNDLILRDRNADSMVGSGNLGKSGSGLEERVYVQQDANYNVISLTSQTGSSVLKRYVYDPYGSVTILDSSWAASTDGTLYWSHYFQGGMQFGPGDLYIFGARLYSPVLGRWVQQDPARYVDGNTLYALESDAPGVNLDPSGLHRHGSEFVKEQQQAAAAARQAATRAAQAARLQGTENYGSNSPCSVTIYGHYAFGTPDLGYHIALQINLNGKHYRVELLGNRNNGQNQLYQVGSGPVGFFGIPSGIASGSSDPSIIGSSPGVEGTLAQSYGTYIVPNGNVPRDWSDDPPIDGTPILPPKGVCPCDFAKRVYESAVRTANQWNRGQIPYDGITHNSNTFIGNIVNPVGGTFLYPGVPRSAIAFFGN